MTKASRYAASTLQRLLKTIHEIVSTDLGPSPHIIMYFDEAQSLDTKITAGKQNARGKTKTLYDTLLESLDLFSDQRHAIVYPTSIAHVVELPPPKPLSPSAIKIDIVKSFWDPITEIGQDLGTELPLDPGNVVYDREKLSRLQHFASFGRPLYVHPHPLYVFSFNEIFSV